MNFDNPLTIELAVCQETMDEELEADGTNIPTVPLYSRLTSLRLNTHIIGSAAGYVRWLLYKKPDGEALVTALGSQFMNSDDTPTARETRKMTIAKGMVFVSPDKLATPAFIRVSRMALRRISSFRENDRLSLIIAKDSAGTTGSVSIWGQSYFKANA